MQVLNETRVSTYEAARDDETLIMKGPKCLSGLRILLHCLEAAIMICIYKKKRHHESCFQKKTRYSFEGKLEGA